MKLRGYSDLDDWSLTTFLYMLFDSRARTFHWVWEERQLKFLYTWYDGPLFVVWLGPICVSLWYH